MYRKLFHTLIIILAVMVLVSLIASIHNLDTTYSPHRIDTSKYKQIPGTEIWVYKDTIK